MLRPPHPKGCDCEWCNAFRVARRGKQWKPIHRDIDASMRQEAPNEKPFVPVVRIDEVAVARNRKKRKAGRSHHPSVVVSQEHEVVGMQVDSPTVQVSPYTNAHKPMDYFPSYESVEALAPKFPRVARPKPKSSGCWWCEGNQRIDEAELCGVCENLWADYKAYLEQRPLIEI